MRPSLSKRLSDPLRRDGFRGAQLLREQAHAELLEHPANPNELLGRLRREGNSSTSGDVAGCCILNLLLPRAISRKFGR